MKKYCFKTDIIDHNESVVQIGYSLFVFVVIIKTKRYTKDQPNKKIIGFLIFIFRIKNTPHNNIYSNCTHSFAYQALLIHLFFNKQPYQYLLMVSSFFIILINVLFYFIYLK